MAGVMTGTFTLMVWWRIRALLAVLFMLPVWGLSMTQGARADDLESGVEAYNQGNYQDAIDAWMPLADEGNRDALFNMGQLYRMGKGVPRDPVMAEYFYRKAADKGHLAAQGNLGTLYYFGFEDSPRVASAIRWWQQAAKGGDARSQYMIGILYYNGEHLRRDPVRAYAWIRKASVAGLPEAVEAEQRLIRALTVKDLAAGNTLSPRVQDLPVEYAGGPVESPPPPPASAPRPAPELDVPAEKAPQAPEGPEADELDGFYVQLAALGSGPAAAALRDRLQQEIPELVAGMRLAIEEAQLGDGRMIHRVLLGGFTSRAAAAARCDAFKDAGRDCFVVAR